MPHTHAAVEECDVNYLLHGADSTQHTWHCLPRHLHASETALE